MNHGPDEKDPEGLGPDLEGLGPDELGLRRLLHSAVDGLEPRTGTLEHLRRAVPARRARKRRAVVGTAAAALFFGTAIPALVHVSDSGGADPNTAMAGQSSQAQGGTGHDKDRSGDAGGTQDSGAASTKPGRQSGRPGEKGRSGGGATGSTGGAGPTPTLAAGGVPPCTAAQLGSATGSTDAPDSAGIVYGTFKVANVSAAACSVAGAGTVTPTARGAADQAKITTARHTAGDAATGLPDPSLEVSGLVLQPGAAYDEKFAFVPSQTCPTTGGTTTTGGSATGGATPDPTPSQNAGATGGSATGATTAGTTAQPATGGTADGSVVVTHTAQGGSPSASATVPAECAGTVYYTGVLAGS
ncbi:hypothetical protein A6P39_020640 [Streptomyces sp. FXJ1.172]|uniref:hypothetical protein n=1 Tax=Streptomyces sp. FXJ1.172 TaxID=710705 RepID=UPI0007CFC6EC|nr:hypothetical protein [Streptomyces sp. FXJ1.172]WEO96242.1 hypothetical protein A6P39_020640 [Streptomyces sp. FXJ1.172]